MQSDSHLLPDTLPTALRGPVLSITVPSKKEGKHLTVLNVVLVCLLHARIQEFTPREGGVG